MKEGLPLFPCTFQAYMYSLEVTVACKNSQTPLAQNSSSLILGVDWHCTFLAARSSQSEGDFKGPIREHLISWPFVVYIPWSEENYY